MSAFAAAKDFLAQQHLAPLLSQVQQNLVSLNKWDTVGKSLQVRSGWREGNSSRSRCRQLNLESCSLHPARMRCHIKQQLDADQLAAPAPLQQPAPGTNQQRG
jgi:hypothetical protein